MIGYLIDTNVISGARKKKPHGGALAWLESLAVGQSFFSAVTFGEIQKGIEITRRLDPAKANEIEVWARSLERLAGPRHGRSMFSRICQIDPRPLFGSFRGRYDRRHITAASCTRCEQTL